MYKNIMVPVDLAHESRLEKALATAADLGRHYGAEIHLVGVTGVQPGAVAHTPEEYKRILDEFADRLSRDKGVGFHAHAEVSHDTAVELDKIIERKSEEIGVDLVIMASHVPGFVDHFVRSNAGYLVEHSKISVFVVRG